MKKFRVKGYFITTVIVEIEADNELDAIGKYNKTIRIFPEKVEEYHPSYEEQLAEDVEAEEII